MNEEKDVYAQSSPAPHASQLKTKDQSENLKLLSIFHYVLGGLHALFSFFPLAYVAMGIFFLNADFESTDPSNTPPPEGFQEMFGGIMIGIGLIAFLILLGIAICIILAGRYISQRRSHLFCLITAAVSCMFFPFGTALGVCALIVLTKPEVKQLFDSRRAV